MSTIHEVRMKLDRLRELPDEGVRYMKAIVPVGPTGNLKKHIEARPLGEDMWEIVADVPYAAAVNNGRRPLEPKNAPFLVFEGYAPGPNSFHKKDDSYRSFSNRPPNPYVLDFVRGTKAHHFREKTRGHLVQVLHSRFS